MKQIERRIFELTDVREVKDEGKPTLIEGYAAVFQKNSLNLGGFVERIRPGTFARSIRNAKENPVEDMIHVFWSHDPAQPLASTRSGKLVLREDGHGLRFAFPAARLTPQQLEAIQDGDMRMSFGFVTQKDVWTRGAGGKPDERELIDADLLEISPVSKPAYPQTVVGAREHPFTAVAIRSYDEWQKTQDAPTPAAHLQSFKDRLAVVKASL